MNVPPGYVLAAWVIAGVSGETESAWLYRHEGSWHVRQETLVATKGARRVCYDAKLLPSFRRKNALRVAQEAADALLAQMHGGVAMRVDLGTKDRSKLHAKIARSPLARAILLAERNQRKESGKP